MDRSEIAEHVKLMVAARLSITPNTNTFGGACFLYAGYGFKVLEQLGYEPLIQAGSCSWPIIPKEEDDGACDTHFSFIFKEEEAIQHITRGRIPEIHVFLYLQKTEELVDFSTHDLPRVCNNIIGKKWSPKCLPPPFLWCHICDMPPGVNYEANLNATYFVRNALHL